MSISFVLPVLCETAALRTTVETIVRLSPAEVHEVLIVLADRSTPESAYAAEQLRDEFVDVVRLHWQKLPGLGGAIAEAFTLAGGTHVMLMAADLETDPEEIPRFVEKMREANWDIVAGSRWMPGGGFQRYGPARLAANWMFQQCLRLAFTTRLTDLSFAYRLYRREAIEGIRWEESGHAMLLECMLKPLRLGARVAEVPCQWRRRGEGVSAGSFRGMLGYLPTALRLRMLRKDQLTESPAAKGAGQVPKALWLILIVALLLRLYGAWQANLIFDERAHLALAQTINFQPGQFHLVSRTLDHPLLSIYVLKLSGMLFGESDFGLRLLHVLAGTATVLAVFFLGRRVFGEKAGLWAAGLLAVDQFHATWSRVFMPEVLMLLFAALAVLQMLRALETGSRRSYLLLGLLLGLAYLAKEPAVLLIAGLWVFLIITPQYRRVLADPRWYLAHAVCLLVVAPDVIWNLCQSTDSYLYRDASIAAEPWRLSLKPLSLYLGELFRVGFGADVLDKEYVQGNVYVCYWAAGVIYLAATAAAIRKAASPGVRLLLVTFVATSAVFFILPGGDMFEPFWWASISLIPAVVFGGWALDWASEGRKVSTLVAILLLAYMAGHLMGVIRRPGPCLPRATVEDFAGDFIDRAAEILDRAEALDRGELREAQLREAQHRFIYALNIGGGDADAYVGLAKVALLRKNPQKAKTLAKKALELDPKHPAAIQLIERIERNTGASRMYPTTR